MAQFTKTQIGSLQKNLLEWFSQNKRSLPWRTDKNWYKKFLSEIILQQTTVEQGLPYFLKIFQRYPDIKLLAETDEQELLRLWAGLGYYSRARNMLKAAQQIMEIHDGTFPIKMEKALNLKGIGPYTAAAILSIAFNKYHAVVDGNVMRVIARLFGIRDDLREGGTVKSIRQKASLLLSRDCPGDFNEAMMELGAVICKPRLPLCTICPLITHCITGKKGNWESVPYKSKAPAKYKRFNIITVFKNNEHWLIVRRPDKGLLASMWEFPFIETDATSFKKNIPDGFADTKIIAVSDQYRQIYSHIDLKYRAVLSEGVPARLNSTYKWIKWGEFEDYPIHNAHKKIIPWLASVIKTE